MNNKEQMYSSESDQYSDHQHPQSDYYRAQNFLSSRHKNNNIIISNKSNRIFGTYSRLIPKKPPQDIQRLYAQNIQLKQKIRFLEENNTKIKTRVSMIEKQKQHLITQVYNMDSNFFMTKGRGSSQHRLSNRKDKPKQIANEENRKILHGYQDQINKIKLQNGRLKKTLKYTQIQQIQIENQNLHTQLTKMKQYLQNVLQQNEHEQCEKKIQTLTKQLLKQKQSNKLLYSEIKKKQDQIQQQKNKIKVLVNRKMQLQKKYTRDINNAKEQLLKVKEKEIQKSNSIKNEKTNVKNNKIINCAHCKSNKETVDNQKNRNNQLSQKLNVKEKQINQIKKKLEEMEKQMKEKQFYTTKLTHENLITKQNFQNINIEKKNKETNEEVGKQTNTIQKKAEKQQKCSDNHNNQNSYCSQKFEQQYNVEEAQSQQENEKEKKDKTQIKQLKKSIQKNEEQLHNSKEQNEVFKKDSDDEQFLFQKQQKAEKKKTSNKTHQHKQKIHEKITSTKAQKILKETIKYRLMAQRYTYSDFQNDVNESNEVQFTAEELIQILSNEPFYLGQEHLKIIIIHLFEKTDIEPDEKLQVGTFLKKMKQFIGDFRLQCQQEEEQMLKHIKQKLLSSKNILISKLTQEASGHEISKKNFIKILKQSGLTEQQIQQCVAEVSMMSVDIAHINYLEFIQKITGES